MPDYDQVNGYQNTNMISTTHRFGLATLDIDGHPAAALYAGKVYWPLKELGFGDAGIISLLHEWDSIWPQLQRTATACISGSVASNVAISPEQALVLAPLRHPSKIVGIAFNYRSALIEAGMPPVVWDPLPLFVRPVTNTLVGSREGVHMPVGEGLDWEVEIGVIMSRRMRNVSAEEGMRGVGAYVVCVDLTVRDLVMVDTPFKTDMFRAKCQDALSPIGPVITPAAFVADPYSLQLRLSVNGAVKQQESSADMLVRIGELISEASRYLTWEPGDLLLTGTPAGVGRFKGPYLKPGDRVRAEVEGLEPCEFEVLPRLRSPVA